MNDAADASQGWSHAVAVALGSAPVAVEPVAGGDINEAFRVRLADGRVVFVKTHADPPQELFRAEARGLLWLSGGQLRVPGVLAVGDRFLALEWLPLQAAGCESRRFQIELGCGLAQLHQRGADGFGLDHDNYLATLPQRNRPEISSASSPCPSAWPEFFIERRLRPFAACASRAGHMPDVNAALDRLRGNVDRFGPDEPPARLHGDLWWGNVAAVHGSPVIFDPAVYGGHREVDLAMLAWAGGLPDAVVSAYQEVSPLAQGWRERLVLWQLLPLIAHAALFGGGYGAQAVRALARL